MLSPYDIRTEEARRAITGNISKYYTNKYYPVNGAKHTYFYINQKGYLHIIRPCKVKYNGRFSHYEISDVLLTADNKLKETSCTGFFRTIEETVSHIEENLAQLEDK